jgi:hypothetical protein
MMTPSLLKKFEELEERCSPRRQTHIIWLDDGAADPAPEIAARIASGHAAEGDRFFTAAWRSGGTETPMACDLDRFASADALEPAPAVPEAANDRNWFWSV